MDNPELFVKKIIELMGFSDYRVDVDEAHKHGVIFIHDNPTLIKENLAVLVEHINHLTQQVARKQEQPFVFFDVNNYRKERESLIVELARAAARKVLTTKKTISLPVMNSYERRLVHMELAIHPEVTTESIGAGKGRYVVIKPIEEEKQGELKTEPPKISVIEFNPSVSEQEDVSRDSF